MATETMIVEDKELAGIGPGDHSHEPANSRLPYMLEAAVQHHRAGKLIEAEAIYHQILQEFPDHADAWHLLGMIAYHRVDYDLAFELVNKAIGIDASMPIFHNNLGNVLKQQGKLNAAAQSYYEAIGLNSDYADAYYNLGTVFRALERLEAAVECYREALRLQPDFPEAYNNLGNVLKRLGNFDGATMCYEQAIRLRPDYGSAHMNLGLVLQAWGKLDQAIHQYRKALHYIPDFPEAHNNLGNALNEQGRTDAAIEHYYEALRLLPDFPEAHNNLIAPLGGQGDLKGCIKHYNEAIRLQPNLAEAHNNLAKAMIAKYRLKEAIKLYRQALEIRPDFAEAHSNLLFNLLYHHAMDASESFAEHLRWARQHAAPLASEILPHPNDREPDRRLRLGYCSPDLCSHPVAIFIEPLLASHDRSSLEIYCYSDVARPDGITERLRNLADHWRNISGMSHEQAAARVRDDRIDILVDLAGHTSNNRMLMFARKPAPVQVSYLGYPNTTGLPTMSYRITDSYADPEGQADAFYSEELVRLPHSFLCYQPPKESPEVDGLPALDTGRITFGSFNNLSKVTPRVIDLWSTILRAVPHARLILKASQLADDETRQRLQEMFVLNDVAAERVKLMGRVSSFAGHLALYSEIDIGLDPFPYNGTTTTCEALWMGVPVIVMAGRHHASRVGVSILTNIGLTDLITDREEGYAEKAVSLACDLKRLKGLRAGLRQMVSRSPLTNSHDFIISLEQSYRKMWIEWCESRNARTY